MLPSVRILLLLPGFLAQKQQPVVVERTPVYLPSQPREKPFDVTRRTIQLEEIQAGGPARDGIPALHHPLFISSSEADQVLQPSDVVLGVEFAGTSKAYPIRILNWHEVVNDDVGGQSILITWCPLCGSGMVYDPYVDGKRLTFGVSGRLYKHNLLLFDRETESLWSQLAGQAVSGPLAGTSLRLLPAHLTTWADWKAEYRTTLVLSFQTGFARDYATDPYRDRPLDRRLSLVVSYRGFTKIYPYAELKKAGSSLMDQLGGLSFLIEFNSQTQSVTMRGIAGGNPPNFVAFFAEAKAFYPDAKVFKAHGRNRDSASTRSPTP